MLAEAIRRGHNNRSHFVGDPDYFDVPVKKLLSKERTIELAKSFLEKLRDMEKFFESQTAFHNFGCSMLFVYEFGDSTSAQIRLIDFVHSLHGNGKIDENFLFGLQNVRLLFEDFISVDNN